VIPQELSEERKTEYETDPQLFQFQLDTYTLPSLMIKVIKSMKLFEVCEFKVTSAAHNSKLQNYFPNQYFDQKALFKDAEQVSIIIGLCYISKDEYFYQMKVARKLARIQHLKGIAGNFFKAGVFEKAARIYQKINGYYNFGDSTNNYQKEDD